MGICGGFQMLGRGIHDPLGLEGAPGSSAGLGLLDLETTLEQEKQLRNVQWPTGASRRPAVAGYEIHAGVTQGPALARPAVHLTDGRPDGAIGDDDQVLGTYLHGLFESSAALAALLTWAGLRQVEHLDYEAMREAAFDRLADTLDQHLDPHWLQSLIEGAQPLARGLGTAGDATPQPPLPNPPPRGGREQEKPWLALPKSSHAAPRSEGLTRDQNPVVPCLDEDQGDLSRLSASIADPATDSTAALATDSAVDSVAEQAAALAAALRLTAGGTRGRTRRRSP